MNMAWERTQNESLGCLQKLESFGDKLNGSIANGLGAIVGWDVCKCPCKNMDENAFSILTLLHITPIYIVYTLRYSTFCIYIDLVSITLPSSWSINANYAQLVT